MRVIIAGSRNVEITNEELENIIKDCNIDITILLNGKCPTGIDNIAYKWAKNNSVKIEEYEAEWNKYGKSAGPRRNRLMASNADCLIAIYKENLLTPGTKNMIDEATKCNLKVFRYTIK